MGGRSQSSTSRSHLGHLLTVSQRGGSDRAPRRSRQLVGKIEPYQHRLAEQIAASRSARSPT